MYHVKLRKNTRARRKLSIRKKLAGTKEAPRLTVFRSNKYIYAQLIDDVAGNTLASVSSSSDNIAKGKNKSETALEAGKELAKKAKAKGIKMAVFDRNGYKYHGRVAKLAEGAREGGLTL